MTTPTWKVARADLMNVAASLARLSFFAEHDADQISHQTHDNILMLAQRTKRSLDVLSRDAGLLARIAAEAASYEDVLDDPSDAAKFAAFVVGVLTEGPRP